MSDEEVITYSSSDEVCYADWSSIHKLAFSYFWEVSTIKNGKARVIEQSKWLSPSSWGQPDVAVYEVPWDLVKTETKILTSTYMKNMRRLAERDPIRFEREVSFLRNQLPRKRKAVRTRIRRASDQSMRNLAKVVDNLEDAKWAAEFVRNRATDTLLIGATFLSGGAAFAVLGTGALMTGTGTYQDTGNLGTAAIKTVGAFTMGAIPIGAAGRVLSASEKGAVLFLGATFDATEAIVDGKSGSQALVSAGLGVAGGFVGDAGGEMIERFLKTPNGRRMLAKSAAVHRIPLTIPLSKNTKDVVGRGKLVSAVLSKYMVGTPIDAAKGKAVDSMAENAKGTSNRRSRSGGTSVAPIGTPLQINGGTVQFERTPNGGSRMTVKGQNFTSVTDRSFDKSKTRWFNSKTGRQLHLHEPGLTQRVDSLLLAPK